MNAIEVNNTQDLKADVVVIGSGGGLAAAVAAREGGASVILLEKVGVFGGWTRQANAFMAIGSPVQKRQDVSIDGDEFFHKFMEYNHWHRVNPSIARAFFKKSGDTVRWLEEKGVEFDLLPNQAGQKTIHMPTDMMASVQDALLKSAQELGVTLFSNTSGKKIIRGAKGRIIGVVAVKDGEEFEIPTRCVVIATGGFGANRQLLKKYCRDYYDEMLLWTWPPYFIAHSGDGMYMAEEIGAAMAEWVPNYHRGGSNLGGYPWKPDLPGSINRGMIWVNKRGKRYADEAGGADGGNTILMQPDQIAYSLFADDVIQTVEAGGGDMPGPAMGRQKQAKLGGGAIITEPTTFTVTEVKEKLRELAEKDKIKMADSWEEMADWMGVDPEALKAEIAAYNSYCDKGYDEAFARSPKTLVPLRQPPYYGIKMYGDVGETLGGIIVDEHMAVLDKRANIIPGVYAAGVIADGHQGQTYSHGEFGGMAAGFAVVSGHIAGESVAKYIKEIQK